MQSLQTYLLQCHGHIDHVLTPKATQVRYQIVARNDVFSAKHAHRTYIQGAKIDIIFLVNDVEDDRDIQFSRCVRAMRSLEGDIEVPCVGDPYCGRDKRLHLGLHVLKMFGLRPVDQSH